MLRLSLKRIVLLENGSVTCFLPPPQGQSALRQEVFNQLKTFSEVRSAKTNLYTESRSFEKINFYRLSSRYFLESAVSNCRKADWWIFGIDWRWCWKVGTMKSAGWWKVRACCTAMKQVGESTAKRIGCGRFRSNMQRIMWSTKGFSRKIAD